MTTIDKLRLNACFYPPSESSYSALTCNDRDARRDGMSSHGSCGDAKGVVCCSERCMTLFVRDKHACAYQDTVIAQDASPQI